MATEKSVTFPKISKKIWMLLRARFKKTLPSNVGSDYIVSTSTMSEGSAQSNVLRPLKDLKIIDDQGKPTALAERWRHDDEYLAVCHEIRALVYPSTLLESYPDADLNQREGIKKWFMKNAKVGDAAGKMFADTYILLSKADLTNPEGDSKSPVRTASAAAPKKAQAKKASSTLNSALPTAPAATTVAVPVASGAAEIGNQRRLPSVHIDVQVHINPDTTPEQIDRIFASMSKHLGSYIT